MDLGLKLKPACFPLGLQVSEFKSVVVLALLWAKEEVHIDRQVLMLPDLFADDFTSPTPQAITENGLSHLAWN